jgi:hypothetical protein
MVKVSIFSIGAVTALATGCGDDHYLRVEVVSQCEFREVTAGRVSESFPAGSTAVFEHHNDSFANIAITLESTCGSIVNRYTVSGRSCEQDSIIRSNIHDVRLLIGEIAELEIRTDTLFYGRRDCDFSNGRSVNYQGQTYSPDPQ